jgi:NitT/TauT family transport system substrate-binding protein
VDRSNAIRRGGAVTLAGLLLVGSAVPLVAQSPSAAAPAVPEPETKSFVLAIGGPGVSTVGILATVADLNADGWSIETPELTAGELQLQGVASGDFQISSGNGNNVLVAAQQGLPVKAIASRIKNEWTLYATSDITECAQLDGKRLAIHSEGSPATFMTRNWIEQNCPGINPEYIILPGSENRYAALLQGEIDASPIELSDAIALEAEGGDRFARLTAFADTLPNLLLTPVYANTQWTAENPNTTTAFLVALLENYRRFNEDPEYFKQRIIEVLPGINQDTLDAVVENYVALGMYDGTGGITPEQQQFSIDFITEAGGIEPGLSPDQAYDRTYLDAALAILDGTATE